MYLLLFLSLAAHLPGTWGSLTSCPEQCFNKTFLQTDMVPLGIQALADPSFAPDLATAQGILDELCVEQQVFADCLGSECSFGAILQQYAPINSNPAIRYICLDHQEDYKNFFLPCITENRQEFSVQCGGSIQQLLSQFRNFAKEPMQAAHQGFVDQLCSSVANAGICMATITQQRCSPAAQMIMRDMLQNSMGNLDPQAIAAMSPTCGQAFEQLQAATTDNQQLPIPAVEETSPIIDEVPAQIVIILPSPQMQMRNCINQCAAATLTINGAQTNVELLGVQAALTHITEAGIDGASQRLDSFCSEQHNFAMCLHTQCGPEVAQKYSPLLNNGGMQYMCIHKRKEFESQFLSCIANNKDILRQQCGPEHKNFMDAAKVYNSQPDSLGLLDELCKTATYTQVCTANVVREQCGADAFLVMAEKFQATFGDVSFAQAGAVVPSCSQFLNISRHIFDLSTTTEVDNQLSAGITTQSDSDSDSDSNEGTDENPDQIPATEAPPTYMFAWWNNERVQRYHYIIAGLGGVIVGVLIALVSLMLCRCQRAKPEDVENKMYDVKL